MARRSLTNSAAIKKSSSAGLKKTGSKVSFDESPKTILVEPPIASQNASWYSPDELSSFRKGESNTMSKTVRKEFVRTLLTVQNEHKAMGIQDPKGLRQMSRAISKESIKSAIRRAHEVVHEDESWSVSIHVATHKNELRGITRISLGKGLHVSCHSVV